MNMLMNKKPEEQSLSDRLSEIEIKQKAYFDTGATLSYEFRKAQLKKLKSILKKNEERIEAALKADLGKPEMEAFLGETGFIYEDIKFALKNLREWMQPEEVPTPLAIPLSSSKVIKEPYGRVLIISPWNYPFQLLISPLVGAISAGNCAVLKPSELAPHLSAVVKELIEQNFEEEFIAVVEGGVEVSQALLERKFDYIFFTGSTAVGKIIAQAAAKTLTPVTLELGGKSPCIVDQTANLKISAKRIIFGKFFNAGQTCVAPDYVLVHHTVKDELVEHMKYWLGKFYGGNAQTSPDYGRIVSESHFDRLEKLLKEADIIHGGETSRHDLYFEPTLVQNVMLDDPLMKEEIFGPILPINEYHNLDMAIGLVKQNPDPLALYVFTNDDKVADKIVQKIPFGGGCINNTLYHLANPHLPFGGVGSSGVGMYHGKYSFDTFSHHKSLVKSKFLDPSPHYQPYKKKKSLMRLFFN